jgi:hypothetical protein
MSSFLALYRGTSIGTAKIVAVTAESSLVADFSARMLRLPEQPEPDAVIHELERGRRRALELVQDEAEV